MSNEVKYSINGRYFKTYGVYVSESTGIMDTLKRKPVQAFDWPEYHGISVDLSKPKYQERVIELECFIVGENWQELFDKFNVMLRDEFAKGGTQRLLIEPFGYKALPYEVFMTDDIKVEKVFRQGRMIATFSIKMIEPNPVKKVITTLGETMQVSFDCDSEVEIFWGDGTKQSFRKGVDEVKDYTSPSYEISENSLVQSSVINNNFYEVVADPTSVHDIVFTVNVTSPIPQDLKLFVIGRHAIDNTYELLTQSPVRTGAFVTLSAMKSNLLMNDYGKFIYKVLNEDGNEVPGLTYSNVSIRKAFVNGNWQDMSGLQKYAIVAGNIEDIENLITDSDVLWTKL